MMKQKQSGKSCFGLMLISALLLGDKVAGAFVKFTDEDNPCKFKGDYFSEFDLNPLTKPDG